MHIQGDIAFLFGTPEQEVKAVTFDVCNPPPPKKKKLIDYHSIVPWATAKLL